jgi:DNA-binding CsgD family transcriptional regulator/tetratricopeptide (TPR) repeat protein
MPVLVAADPALAVGDFLTAMMVEPSALVIEGEPGIGKTTHWLAGVEQAREQGFTVLVARPVAVESVLSYASLADLLSGIEALAWARLPEPQRRAIDRIMSRANDDRSSSDQQAVAAGFLSVIEELAEQAPVLLAIDDLQWLDTSSARVVGFAARRLSGRVGALATLRTEVDGGDGASWLQLPTPDAIRRVRVPALSLGGLHRMIAERLGRSFTRPTLLRIMEISGGNPFYALELARVIDVGSATGESALPGSLAELVGARLGGLDEDVKETLLAAACLAAPTVELVAQSTDTGDAVVLLEDAEASGIIGIDGGRLRFTHPLLSHGVYSGASPARRRRMHRRLAEIVAEPELQARHLALGTTTGDPVTVRSLDAAAEIARRRGAPEAAAELLELAIGLGGDTVERRISTADHRLDAGDVTRARALLEATIETCSGMLRAEALNLLGLAHLVDDSNLEAIDCFQRALAEMGDFDALRTEILTVASFCHLIAGNPSAALRTAQDAVTYAESLDHSQLLSQALIMRVYLGMVSGSGVDEPSLRRALLLEDRDADAHISISPRIYHVMILAYSGRLDEAHSEMLAVWQRCLDRGEEPELVAASFYLATGEVWGADFPHATEVAEDAVERALQMGGDQPLMFALTARATVYAYTGRVDEARRDMAEALAASHRASALMMAGWQLTTVGFLEVSLSNYEAALATLEPLVYMVHAAPQATEIFVGGFIADAVEAFVQLGRLDEAEPLVAALESNGTRLDRAWMLAVGGRCRAMLLAARGNLDAANDAVLQAMCEHDRLPMPFERTRTQLLLGQLQRRQGQRSAAKLTLHEALAAFETLGTPLWAEKARAAIARSNVGPKVTPGLTPSEQQVAELAASGMTNRDVAAALFISPKTVEANLSRVYHKLGIRSRAELGRYMAHPDD